MTTTLENSDAVQVTRGSRMSTITGEIPGTMRAGRIATASSPTARSIRASRSRATSTCLVGWNERSCATAIANTPYAARRRERWRPSARFGWSPVVISEITAIVRSIHAQVTCGTSREHAVALTKQGRSLLEHHRDRDEGDRQTFWDGLKRERELEHDLQVYRAYERDAERLAERGARVERVILDHELKREYQSWLHERDRDRPDYNGHPDRTDEEIRDWALEHDLPYFDDEVHFPDLRIEYQEADGRWDHDDIEVTTEHYRGGHAASVAQSGFSCYGGSTLRIGGRGGSSRGGGGHHGGLAAEMWD